MMKPIAVVAGDDGGPIFKKFRSALGEHLLVVPHSRIFDLTDELAMACEPSAGRPSALLAALGGTCDGEPPLDCVVQPPPQNISLNVSSSCNLACSYCYATRGSFDGAQLAPMSWEVARAAVEQLLRDADPVAPITIGFLGGEPFANRNLLHRVVHYAVAESEARRLDVRFSVTTNGTLLRQEDVELLRSHRFAVTVSIDGGSQVQDRQRPLGTKHSSHALLRQATASLLADPGLAIIGARATVTAFDLNLRQRFEDILSLGFPEAGFAPLRAAGDTAGAFQDDQWPEYLDALVETAKPELARARRGESIRLTNFAVALRQLYRGASLPYPCGAGGGYFSVAADGNWYACHRAIGSSEYRVGNNQGLEVELRRKFLETRHVHSQPACRRCWARYLCSGGCHQEASNRTESSCDFIRGWLEFCLTSYCELIEWRPEFFDAGPTR